MENAIIYISGWLPVRINDRLESRSNDRNCKDKHDYEMNEYVSICVPRDLAFLFWTKQILRQTNSLFQCVNRDQSTVLKITTTQALFDIKMKHKYD